MRSRRTGSSTTTGAKHTCRVRNVPDQVRIDNFQCCWKRWRIVIAHLPLPMASDSANSSEETSPTCCQGFFGSIVNRTKSFRLLNGKGKELETQEQAVQVSDESCNTESLSTLKEKLDEIDQNYQESRNQCQRLEDENDKLKESNTLLQNRLKELAHIQEDDKSRPNQHMVNDIRKQYMKKLEAKDDELLKFKIEMNDQDQLIKRQRSQLDETIKNLNAANKVKSNLTNRIADQDKKIARIELHSQHGSSAKNPVSREEMRIVRESLRSLRSNFTSNNPQQHTIDTVEQSIVTLMERFHSLEANTTSNNSSGPSDTRFPADHDPSKFNSYAAEKSSRGVKKSVLDMNTKTEDFTKVLYYTERGATPYLCHIPKRLGEVTLSDFKDVFDRPGSFRFHFKTMDPEFGMVKEEVIGDDDILPSIEGKIIGWVEEEN